MPAGSHRQGSPTVGYTSLLVGSASPIVGGLGLVFYWVADLDRAVAFYRDLLGLPLARRDGNNWAEFDAGGRRFALHAVGEGLPVNPGGATAVFRVEDLDRAKSELL